MKCDHFETWSREDLITLVLQLQAEIATLRATIERLQTPPPPPRKHRNSFFVFLQRTDVKPTITVAEQAVRPSVIHTNVTGGFRSAWGFVTEELQQKRQHTNVTGGFRSAWGAQAYAALCSVIDTAE